MVLGHLGPAPLAEGTRVRRLAVGTNGHLGHGPVQHPQLRARFAGHGGQHGLDLTSDVRAHEQLTQIGEPALAVEVHDLDVLDGQPRAAQHVRLNRAIRQMLRLHAGGGLHLDDRPGRADALEHIHRHEDVVHEERRLEDGRSPGREYRLRPGDAAGKVAVMPVDKHAPGELLPRSGAYEMALIEDGLLGRIGSKFRSVRLVHTPPQLFVTLAAADEA